MDREGLLKEGVMPAPKSSGGKAPGIGANQGGAAMSLAVLLAL